MHRTIKSFVLRAGRMSNRQQEGFECWFNNYALMAHSEYWDFKTIFAREAETVLEIGFGMGHSLFKMALTHPELNFIGIEVHKAGVGSLAADLHEHQLSNVRIVNADAVATCQQAIAPGSLAGVQIYFPDPWPKKRHHKRRLIQLPFVHMLTNCIKKGGFIHCATDWENYAVSMLEVFNQVSCLTNASPTGDFIPRPARRPLTKFELRGQNLGHGVYDVFYLKS